jgi:hypothetical protein
MMSMRTDCQRCRGTTGGSRIGKIRAAAAGNARVARAVGTSDTSIPRPPNGQRIDVKIHFVKRGNGRAVLKSHPDEAVSVSQNLQQRKIGDDFSGAKIDVRVLIDFRQDSRLASMKSTIYLSSTMLIQFIFIMYGIFQLHIQVPEREVALATKFRPARPIGIFHTCSPNSSRPLMKIAVILSRNDLRRHVAFKNKVFEFFHLQGQGLSATTL